MKAHIAAFVLVASIAATQAAAPDDRVEIPAGAFTMGSDTGPADERPAHPITLPPFRIDRFPVTNETAPVDRFPAGASPYGVQGMAGNAREWVSSAYRPYPYDAKDGREDLTAGPVRGTRGGGHDSPAEAITTTQRGRNLSRNPASGHHNIGFRCAK